MEPAHLGVVVVVFTLGGAAAIFKLEPPNIIFNSVAIFNLEPPNLCFDRRVNLLVLILPLRTSVPYDLIRTPYVKPLTCELCIVRKKHLLPLSHCIPELLGVFTASF